MAKMRTCRIRTGCNKHCCNIWFLLLISFTSDVILLSGAQAIYDTYKTLDMNVTTSMTTTAVLPTYTHSKWTEAYFDPSTPRNVTALMGKSAYLSCCVKNLGNKTVSWIRHRDIHILTVGSYTYTSDQRFQATHHPDTDDWTLQIKWAQKRDAGMYECQISTQPVRSYFVRLNVVVPTATILGGPDLHVDKGSTINLTCTVKFSPEPSAYIFWYHHEEVINYDSSRGGVSVITEKGDITISFLLIQNADLADSGKYSCAPSNADVANVRVHVLNGEHPEAMQTGSSGCRYNWLTIVILTSLVLWLNQANFTIFNDNIKPTATKANARNRIIRSVSKSKTFSTSITTTSPIIIDNTVPAAAAHAANTTTNGSASTRHDYHPRQTYYKLYKLPDSSLSRGRRSWLHNVNPNSFNASNNCISCCEMTIVSKEYQSIAVGSRGYIRMR